jgi:hypothetical protein
MKNLKGYLLETPEPVTDISKWKAKPGSQLGSNAGGIHTDESDVKHYVKFAANPEQAKQEVASARIHEMLGVHTLQPKLIQYHGMIGTATKWRDDLESRSKPDFEHLSPEQAAHIARIHHAGVITKNWDSVGLEHDNIMFHRKTGAPHAVDQGGSLNFRAQGGHKDFGDDINEIKSYRDRNINPQTNHVFSHTFSKHPSVEKDQLTHAKGLSYNAVHGVFKAVGAANAKELATTVIARRDKLLKHYGVK